MLPAPAPVVTIVADYGGQLADYDARVSAYLGRRVRVRIEGQCVSACTLLAALPPGRVCVGPEALLAFHQAYHPNRFDPLDTSIRAEDGTALMMRHYPGGLRRWIAAKGGLTKDLILLTGAELRHLFRPCRAL